MSKKKNNQAQARAKAQAKAKAKAQKQAQAKASQTPKPELKKINQKIEQAKKQAKKNAAKQSVVQPSTKTGAQGQPVAASPSGFLKSDQKKIDTLKSIKSLKKNIPKQDLSNKEIKQTVKKELKGSKLSATRVSKLTRKFQGKKGASVSAELKDAGVKGSDRKATLQYLKDISDIQKKEEKRFQSLADQQKSAFEKQFANQGARLDEYLSTIQSQSSAETQRYESLIGSITGQQERELGLLREQFDRQNQESEGVISRLQSDIERLSTPAAPPKIDVDTRPAVVGIGGFQQASQQRQRRGTSGGRRSAKGAPLSALGLQTSY